MEEPLISIDQFRAELGGIGRTKAYELINAGEVKLVKLGRKSLIAGVRAYKRKLVEAA